MRLLNLFDGIGGFALAAEWMGWENVYKGGLFDTKSYPTKKKAFDKACPEGYVDTVKVEWEE